MLAGTEPGFQIGPYRYRDDDQIGKGSSGKVYQGSHSHDPGIDTRNNRQVAIKAIDMSTITNEVTQYLLESEKQALLNIKSPYVINAIEIIQNKKYCFIISELYKGGTLKEQIQSRKNARPNLSPFNEV